MTPGMAARILLKKKVMFVLNEAGEKNGAGGVSLLLRAAFSGFLASFMMALYVKLVTFKFPLNFFIVGFMIIAGLGFPFGAIAGAKGSRWLRERSGTLALLLIAFASTAVVNQNVTTHFLMGNVYYPYPMPPRAYIFVACLLVSILTSPAIFYAAGALFGDVFSRAKDGHTAQGAFLLGGAAGAVAAYYSVLWAGLYVPLIGGVAAGLVMLPRKKWAAAGVAVCAALMVFALTNKNNVFFVWRIDEYKHLSTHWTPYYRVDFISFHEDHCIGAVHNTLLIWYTCDRVEALPAEIRRIVREVSRDRENILLAGRTDGLYASIAAESGKKLKKFVSISEDPVVAGLMAGKYSRYNGNVFKRPQMVERPGDIRQSLAREAGEGNKYDLVFLNGIGIALMMLPHGVMKQEDYLTTKDNYEVIFNKLLKKDGVFVIDWGSSQQDEIYPMMANAPDGVYVRGFHFWLGEFPLSGLPLFYVVASRDKKALDGIADELNAMPSIKEIKLLRPKIEAAKFTEDKPFHLKQLAPGLMGLMLPLFFMLAVISLHVAYKSPWVIPTSRAYTIYYSVYAFFILLAVFAGHIFYTYPTPAQQKTGTFGLLMLIPLSLGFLLMYVAREGGRFIGSVSSGAGRAAIYFWVAGLCSGLLETCVYSRISRLMPGGPAPGAMYMGVAWFAGFGAAMLVAGWRGKAGAPVVILCGVVVTALLPWISTGLHGFEPAFAAACVLSFAGALPWAAGLFRVEAEYRVRALALWCLGSLAGLYVFQVMVIVLGYRISSYVTGGAYIAAGLFFAALTLGIFRTDLTKLGG